MADFTNPYEVTSNAGLTFSSEEDLSVLLHYWQEPLTIECPLAESEAREVLDVFGRTTLRGAYWILCLGFSFFYSGFFPCPFFWKMLCYSVFWPSILIALIDQQLRKWSAKQQTWFDIHRFNRFWEKQDLKPWDLDQLIFEKDTLRLILEQPGNSTATWIDYRTLTIHRLGNSIQIFTPSMKLFGISSRALSETDSARLFDFVDLFHRLYPSIADSKQEILLDPARATLPVPPPDSIAFPCNFNRDEVMSFYSAVDYRLPQNAPLAWAWFKYYVNIFRSQVIALVLWLAVLCVGVAILLTEGLETHGYWYIVCFIMSSCFAVNRAFGFVNQYKAVQQSIRQAKASQRTYYFTPESYYLRYAFGSFMQGAISNFTHSFSMKDYLVAWDQEHYFFLKQEWCSNVEDFQQVTSWFRTNTDQGTLESLHQLLRRLNAH